MSQNQTDIQELILLKSIMDQKIGFLGLGQMGGALISAFSNFLESKKDFLNLNNTSMKDIFFLCDSNNQKIIEYKQMGFKNCGNSEQEIFKNSKIIFVCVKPDIVEPVLKRNSKYANKDTLIVSIAAGITLEFMENSYINFPKENKPKIMRIMSNHLCSINESSSVFCTNGKCEEIDSEIIKLLLSKVGVIKKVEEKLLNAFTALAGSGPAFVYLFIDSLIEAGLLNGIDYNTSRDFAVQTAFASAKYLKDKNERYPSVLKYVVSTPNGTTIAGLEQLEKNKFKHAVMEAISAASNRAKQIENDKMKLMNKGKF